MYISFIGVLLDSTGDPAYPFLILGCIQTLGGVCILAAQFLNKRFAPAGSYTSSTNRGTSVSVAAELSRSCVSLAM